MAQKISSSILSLVKRQKRLTAREEKILIRRLQSGDKAAATRLVLGHLRFVVFVARKYRRHGHPLAELVQEGMVGLMEAVKRFNPDRGVRLSTYAMWWIRAAIQDYIVRSRSLVRMGTSSAQKSVFLQLMRGKGGVDGEELPPQEVADSLATRFNITVAEVFNLARRMARPDQSLNFPAAGDDRLEAIDTLADDRPTPEEALADATEKRFWGGKLAAALADLPPRESAIIKRRFFSDKAPSRAALGRELGLSKERVRQLEVRALARLRSVLGPMAKSA